jgi:hypothetical protein
VERESRKYGRRVRDDDQLFVMHRSPPRGVTGDGAPIGQEALPRHVSPNEVAQETLLHLIARPPKSDPTRGTSEKKQFTRRCLFGVEVPCSRTRAEGQDGQACGADRVRVGAKKGAAAVTIRLTGVAASDLHLETGRTANPVQPLVRDCSAIEPPAMKRTVSQLRADVVRLRDLIGVEVDAL